MRGYLAAAAACAVLTLANTSAQAATVLDVSWNTGCAKTTCFDDNGVFKQTFSASGFNGPVNISQLLMDRGVLGSLDAKTFRLSFTLNGQEIGTWGQYTMAGIGGDELTFSGEGFTWNPEDGDLVLVLALIPPPKDGVGGGSLFAVLEPESEELDAFDIGTGDETQDDGAGAREPTTAVPEPGVWALMIGGFGMAGSALRRRRTATA